MGRVWFVKKNCVIWYIHLNYGIMRKKVNTSFKFDDQIKAEFVSNLEKNGLNMTEVFEEFMINYNNLCNGGETN